MLKGVTRNIIEINNLNNGYFDRAIIILKDCCCEDEEKVNANARAFIENNVPAFLKIRKAEYRMKIIMGGVAGAVLAFASCAALLLFV